MNTNDEFDEKFDLVKSTKSVLDRIMSLDLLSNEEEDLKFCFKVLILDDHVFEIISPMLKVIYHTISH